MRYYLKVRAQEDHYETIYTVIESKECNSPEDAEKWRQERLKFYSAQSSWKSDVHSLVVEIDK